MFRRSRARVAPPSAKEAELLSAAMSGSFPVVKEILETHPNINVNVVDVADHSNSPLHYAAYVGSSAIVSLLMSHPRIEVNLKNDYGRAPFQAACVNGTTACAKLLLNDSRVKDLVSLDQDGHTPLYWVANFDYVEILEYWIATGSEMNANLKAHIPAAGDPDRSSKVTQLLEKMVEDPARTVEEVRRKIHYYDERAAGLFALVIFTCDDFFHVRTSTREARFFRMASQLPMELQMLLCFRVVGSKKMLIASQERERAFADIQKSLGTHKTVKHDGKAFKTLLKAIGAR